MSNLKCPMCGSSKNKEIITGGITITVFREGNFTVKDEIVYNKDDLNSKYVCTQCGYTYRN